MNFKFVQNQLLIEGFESTIIDEINISKNIFHDIADEYGKFLSRFHIDFNEQLEEMVKN
jgi:hypothetical protein